MTRRMALYQRICTVCKDPFDTDQPTRINCERCSPPRRKVPRETVIPLPVNRPPDYVPPAAQTPKTSAEPEKFGELEERIRTRLEEMALLEDWRAELALGLARDLDRPGVTGAPRTSMTKQLFTLMMEFEGKIPPKADDLDLLGADVDRLRDNA